MTVHLFDVEDAVKHGVHAAVLMQNIRFWIQHNKANGKNEFEGRTWTYNSAKAFAQLFPYMNAEKVKRELRKLVDSGVLLARTLSENTWDRVNWYAFDDELRDLKMPPSPVPPHGADLHNARVISASSTVQKSTIDGADLTNQKTDVNAVVTPFLSDEGAKRPDWFVEAQGEGDPPPVVQPSDAAKLAVALRTAGIKCNGAHPAIQALAAQGVTVETAVAAAEYAKEVKPGEDIPLMYLVKVLESWAKASAESVNVAGAKAPEKQKYGAWWESDATALVVANQVGAGPARNTESRSEWHARIRAAIDNGGTPPAPRPQPVTPLDPVPMAEDKAPSSEASRAAISGALSMLKQKTAGAHI